jgi:hypothetical protein
MTRDQAVNLRVGHKVRCTHFRDRYRTITKIIVPEGGARVIVLEDKVYINVNQIEDVIAA